MSMFHCPLKLPFYMAEGCIQCGICQATTLKQAMQSTAKVRNYIQNQPVGFGAGIPRKICLCGKGGVGKSTLTALFARILASSGYRPLVIDSDESNPSLFRLLGLQNRPKPLLSFLEQFGMEYGIPRNTWIDKDVIALSDIPQEYVVKEQNLSFVELGKVENAFQGCACNISDFSRQLMKSLVPVGNEIVFIDLEAGVESFGRGVEHGIDAVYSIIEPSEDSITLARKMHYMAKGIGISRFGAILNRMPNEEVAQSVCEQLRRNGVPVLGILYYDEEVLYSGMVSRPVKENMFYQCAAEVLENLMMPIHFAANL